MVIDERCEAMIYQCKAQAFTSYPDLWDERMINEWLLVCAAQLVVCSKEFLVCS